MNCICHCNLFYISDKCYHVLIHIYFPHILCTFSPNALYNSSINMKLLIKNFGSKIICIQYWYIIIAYLNWRHHFCKGYNLLYEFHFSFIHDIGNRNAMAEIKINCGCLISMTITCTGTCIYANIWTGYWPDCSNFVRGGVWNT